MPPVINKDTCIKCGICDRSCPIDVIYQNPDTKEAEIRYPEECWMCGSCRQVCPVQAITLRFPLNTLYNASSNPYI